MNYTSKHTLHFVLTRLTLLFLLIITSCKSTKNITSSENLEIPSVRKIIHNHYKNAFNKKSISAKVIVDFQNSKTAVGVTLKLRIEKDKVIWISATKFGIPVAKLMITPNRVQFYEKLSKTYFDGDFSIISKWLGTELNFNEIQNLLLGQAIIKLSKEDYNTSIENSSYQLKPKISNDLFELLFLINPSNFKLNRQEIRNQIKQQLLSISYNDYKKISGQDLPQNIVIRVNSNKGFSTINLDYKSFGFNEELSFPFEIPQDYKEINLSNAN